MAWFTGAIMRRSALMSYSIHTANTTERNNYVLKLN